MCNLRHSNGLEDVTPGKGFLFSSSFFFFPRICFLSQEKRYDVNRSFVIRRSKEEILADSQNE